MLFPLVVVRRCNTTDFRKGIYAWTRGSGRLGPEYARSARTPTALPYTYK